MEIKKILDIVALLFGLTIMIWVIVIAVSDLARKENAKRSQFANAFLIAFSLFYLVRVAIREIIPGLT